MKPLSTLLRATIQVGIFCVFLCSIAGAQVNTGTIVGTITDTSGAVISGADVTITNIGTGQERSVTTDAAGDYSVSDLVAAHYSITVSHSGFSKTTIPDFELQVAQRASINAVLQVGAATEKVVVASSSIQLMNTDNSSVGQVIDTKSVSSMPLNGRDFWQLTQLTPGVEYSPGGAGVPTGGGQIRASAVNVNVNGHSPVFTGWYLDGANISEPQSGGTIIQPNVDALQEFKVEGGNMSARYGHTPTVVNSTLKSGTNQFHGVVYEFLRNNALDAKNYFYIPPPGSTARDEPLHRHQFGGVLGGPIRRNRTYFFVDLETTLLSQGEDFNNIVPSPIERQGNFSQSSTIITDPVTGTPFPGNIIPSADISPQASFLLPYMPAPNFVSGRTYRAINTKPLTQTLIKGDIKIDEQLTAKDHIMGRYSIANNQETDPNPYPAMGTLPLESRGQNVVVNWTRIFTPKWINSLQVSYYRSLFLFTTSFQGQDIASQAGILGLEDLSPPADVGFPTIAITNYSTFTGSPGLAFPKQNRIRSPQYADMISYSSGKHDISFGTEIIHNTLMYEGGGGGVFTFGGQYTGDNFADFLLGYPYEGTSSYYRSLYGNIGTFQGYYIEDNYRASSHLTLNLGFRWEVNPFYWGDKGQISGYDRSTNKLVIPSGFSINAQPLTPTLYPLLQDRIELTNSLGLPRSISPTEKHDLAPRIGFAWAPGKGNWVVRGSYGIFYLFPDDNLINNSVGVPFVASQSLFNTVGSTGPELKIGNFFGNTPILIPNPNPGQPCPFGFVANSCSTPSLTPMALGLQQQYVNEWNLAVQHQFGSKVSLDVAYVANNTFHGEARDSINDPPPDPGSIQTRRPVPQWSTNDLGIFNSPANYNSLQTKLQTQAWHGATLLAAYTFGKCLDNGTYNVDTIYVDSTISMYGPCSYNIKHNLVISYVYQLPFGRGQALLSDLPSWGNAIVGGWQATGITTVQSGLPFSPTISTDTANTGVGAQRPNVVGRPAILKNPTCWFFVAANSACTTLDSAGVSAFSLPAQYTYGNGGRNTMTADDLVEWDFSLTKLFSLGDERSLEIRGEAFNMFNRTTFGAPSTNIDSSSGGSVGATFNSSREIELAAKLYF